MKVSNIGSNMTEVETGEYKVLISYKTPVAYYDKMTKQYLKTDYNWSVTTTKHINKWLNGYKAVNIAQSYLDDLLDKQ